ncbi:hypothetical protein RND81_14G073900 [Saponaria officinalis]|uniref:Uncharacterized protein n=1 Tax=Saponaria officinalis TaxID=3572 RepID=A0AAW1GLT3_SAPOF
MAMNSITPLHHHHHHHHHYILSTPYLQYHTHTSNFKTPKLISFSFAPHRRRRRRNTLHNPKKNKNSDHFSSSNHGGKLEFVLDVDQLKSNTPISIIEAKIKGFLEGGIEAYDDLRSLVRVEPGTNRVIVSCSEKTVRFVGGVLGWSLVAVVVVRVLVKLGLGLGLGFRGGFGGEEVVVRRDRSLGGKEVVVAKRGLEGGGKKKGDFGRNVGGVSEMAVSRSRERERKLPGWWPVIVPRPVVEGNREEYAREAKALVRAIMDDKLRGKDVSEEDILELRRICRRSGVQLSFETDNARDSLYRLSVHNVISTCCRSS